MVGGSGESGRGSGLCRGKLGGLKAIYKGVSGWRGEWVGGVVGHAKVSGRAVGYL